MCKDAEKFVWFIVGAAVGAGIALLYSPTSGKETRRYLAEKGEQARQALAETGGQILERGRRLATTRADASGERS